jgi:hypothetical protein
MRLHGTRMITLTVRRSKHMSNESNILTRVGHGLLAIVATGATVLALQIAMLG